jgi:hypothetical protein
MSDNTTKDTKQDLQQDLERAKREAAELASTAKERGREQLEGAKNRVADGAERIAEAVERATDEVEGDGMVSGYGRSLASMMRKLAGGLRERDIDDLAGELSSFARQHPGAFLASSVALGFAVSRFLKPSGRRGYDDTYDSERAAYDSYDALDPFDLDRDELDAGFTTRMHDATGEGESRKGEAQEEVRHHEH